MGNAIKEKGKNMASKRSILNTSGIDKLQNENKNIENKVDKLVTSKPATKTAKTKPFKKPNSDYYRLELITRETVDGKLTETIKTDYKDYLVKMAAVDSVSITKYIHKLIDNDMKKRKKDYEEIKKLIK